MILLEKVEVVEVKNNITSVVTIPVAKNFKDRTGEKFGRLTIIKLAYIERSKNSKGNNINKVYYICKCECGNEIKAQKNNLISGHTTSCGCKAKETAKINAKNNGFYGSKTDWDSKTKDYSIKVLYSRTKGKAKQRNIEFDLTLEEFSNIITLNCHYCNALPIQKFNPYLNNDDSITRKDLPGVKENLSKIKDITIFYNGIDRKKNNLGYSVMNCVPCCGSCNTFKMDIFSYEEFMLLVPTLCAIMSSRKLKNEIY